MQVSLLDAELCPLQFLGNEPLRISLQSLKSRLESILLSEGFKKSELVVATLHFSPDPSLGDDHCCICRASLQLDGHESVECIVDYMGHKLAQQAVQLDGRAFGASAS